MANKTYLRFNATAGGVSIYLNGFLIVAPDETGRFATRISPYLRPGENLLQIDARSAPGQPVVVSVVDMQRGDPENPEILLDAPAPSGFWQDTFEISAPVPTFEWHSAPEADQSDIARAYEVLVQLGIYLQTGPNEALLRLLDMKHREIAEAVGLTRNEMDNGLSEGLVQKRAAPEFNVAVTPIGFFSPVWSTDFKIMNAMSIGGGDAIQITDSDFSGGFTVALAQLNGEWTVVR